MNIDTQKQFLNLDGEPLIDESQKPIIVGKVLANMVLGSKKDALRSFKLAQEIYSATEVYAMKDSDKAYIVEAVNESPMPTIIKGQMLDLLKK
jgi:hypothetical protein